MAINKPFFVPQKEIDLIDSMNEELIDDIVGQTVDIYKISVDDTETNLYGESTTKYYNKGFRVNCLILYNEPTVNLDEFGPDTGGDIEMYFHRTTLKEANFYPEIGDIVDWNRQYYEMNAVTEPQLIAGHQGFKHEIKVAAYRIRTSNLQIEERIK
jgi:hypothetical protein